MNNEFRKLQINLLLRIFLGAAGAYLLAVFIWNFLIDGLLEDYLAEAASKLGVWAIFQNYKMIIIPISIFGVIAFILYLILSKISHYFDLVSKSIDQIFDSSAEVIELPSELDPIEKKLNTIKNTMQQREFEAKQSEQQKNDLVVYLAHDLKTPLTSVLGYLNLMTDEMKIPEDAMKKYYKIVYNKAMRMELLLDELFEVTRFNVKSMELTKSLVNINTMINQLVEEFYPLLSQKNLTCNVKSNGVCQLVVDADQIARVFDNLLKNAVHYCDENTEINIEINSTSEVTNISFTNYGITIPHDKLERIFEKFYRADESRSTNHGGGAGLGLAIAKKIIELHDGTITAKSENLITTFTVTI